MVKKYSATYKYFSKGRMDTRLAVLSIFVFVLYCENVTCGKTFPYSNLDVKYGTHQCVSNCSHAAAANENVTVICSVDECISIESNSSSAQAPEIEEIYFERYTNEVEQRNRLALHVKWSPVDNVSLETLKGFLLNISDGTNSYSKCYNLATPLKFHQNKHDIFYNDCFGKVKGTFVKPGSTITVHITSLPIWDTTPTDGRTTAIIKVQGCTDEKLHFLDECEPEGGRPTMESCTSDCDTFSVIDGISYPISCDTSVTQFSNIGGPEPCVIVNKTVSGTPAPPKHVQKIQEWYKFIDPESGEVKVALNFSWGPSPDSSFEHTKSYSMEIKPTSKSDLSNFNKCFAIHTVLKEEKHANAEFFYDCYGRISGSSVEPGHEYMAHINSIPHNGENLLLKIKIPNCVDPSMQDVTQCINDNSRVLTAEVEEIYCHNRSMRYKYHVSPQYGKYADILFCELGKQLSVCKNLLTEMENLDLSNTLYNISLPSSANLSIEYTVLVHGTDYPKRHSVRPDFSKCVQKPTPVASTVILIVILVLGVLILFGCAFLVCFYFRKGCNIGLFKKWTNPPTAGHLRYYPPVPIVSPGLPGPPGPPGSPDPTPIQPAPRFLRLYVLFADDHHLHRNTVHWFCSYLKQDLGFTVDTALWDGTVAALNTASYMMSNLKRADKVIVICSEGSRNCLNTDYNGDLFTPAVRNICNEAFIGKNPGKYLVVYFDYSKSEHIPELLFDQCVMYFSIFHLMKQFEQLYFRLVGVEQYQEGGIQRIEKIAFDRYDDPQLTNCGMRLRDSINIMKDFVENNPTWFGDRHGVEMAGSQLPPPPLGATNPVSAHERTEPRQLPEEGLASINHLHLSLPPALHDGATGARRKVVNAAPLVPQPQQPRQHFPEMDVPTQDPGRTRYEHLASVTTSEASDDRSFIVPDTETEDLSISPPVFREGPQPREHEDFFTPNDPHRHPNTQVMYPLAPGGFLTNCNRSYHPESFRSSDFTTFESEDSPLNLVSNETQETRIGLSDMMELPVIREEEHLISIEPSNFDIDTEDSGRRPAGSAESGVFTLAHIDDDDEEDIENQIKSINESSAFE